MTTAIVWHQRDLRVEWNPALSYAVKENDCIIPVYIHDPEFENLGGASRFWLHHSLLSLQEDYKKYGVELILRKGKTIETLEQIQQETGATSIYFNAGFEPPHFKIHQTLNKQADCHIYNGNHLIDPREVMVQPGHPYSVFTPFYKASLKQLSIPKKPPLSLKISGKKGLRTEKDLFKDEKWMKKLQNYWIPGREQALKILQRFIKEGVKQYGHNRDYPSLWGTSRLSPHLHFGEICPHEIWELSQGNESYTRQLFWREFGTYFLFHFPEAANQNWNEKFDKFPWSQNMSLLEKWAKGKTGYPIIDAAMRQLWQTGWMHNRLRMLVASFLTKDLFIHWKRGEEWFWDTLVDADKGNNVLGWQWTAGSGPDAAPYFRIFNPILQGEKFDPEGEFVKRYIPELQKLSKKWIHHPWDAPNEVLEEAGIELGNTYPKPIVDHYAARDEALRRFEKIR